MTATAVERREDGTAFLGMVIFMASWAMLFASLFFAYGIVRAGAPVWPPADLPRIPRLVPSFATAALAMSSVLMQVALRRVRRGTATSRSLALAMAASALLGLLFLAAQTTVWLRLFLGGLRPESGTYGSVFYGLTVFHAVHVVVGVLALGWLSIRAALGAYGPARHVSVRLWTLYWHMVGVIWAATFVLVYLV